MNQLSISKKIIPTHERLIVALDVPAIAEAKLFVEELGESVCFYKIGMELFMSGNCFDFIEDLKNKQKKIFVDLKFFDVPETVGRAIKALSSKGVDFATVHGNDAMLAAAVKEKGPLMVFAVTALTSLDQGDLADLGFKCNVEELVLSRAKRALSLGCDGVISSGLEVGKLRSSLDNKLLVITPGIRPVDNAVKDDQKRVVSVGEAFKHGADYIVMGRPIRDAENRREMVDNIQLEIKRILNI
ncbi:MAG: orotidine-5'-phosphate decarboxylase [Methylococcaceae bacterium]|nr:MAG: orotidine-5'-phosphate decarboxylase [Methylococcaceae bacterium]